MGLGEFKLKTRNWGRVLSLLGLSLSLLTACAPKKSELITECVVNADQKNTFKGHWSTRPVPLAVVATDFSASELNAIQAAIASWNDFYSASKGFQLFLSGSSPLALVGGGGTRITSATSCQQNVIGASGFTKQIMIYKNTSWTFGGSVMALTSLCPVTTANSQFKMFVSAVMEINYVNFFNGGQPVPDLQSIVTHELGHMLGLDHSCTGSGCSGAPSEYVQAIMYPSLGFTGTAGQVKRSIGTNDQQRANCLY